jgi:hypothetical protein
MTRWKHTEKPCEPSRTTSTASSLPSPRRRQPGPTCQPPFSPLPFLLPRARRPPPQPRGFRPALAFPPSFLSSVSTPIKAINPHSNPPAVSPFPLAFFTPGRPAGHQWQAAAAPSPTRLAFHPRVLFKLAHAPLPSSGPRRPWQPCPELTGALPEPPPSSSPPAAASSPPVGPSSSPVRGNQNTPPNSSPFCAQ